MWLWFKCLYSFARYTFENLIETSNFPKTEKRHKRYSKAWFSKIYIWQLKWNKQLSENLKSHQHDSKASIYHNSYINTIRNDIRLYGNCHLSKFEEQNIDTLVSIRILNEICSASSIPLILMKRMIKLFISLFIFRDNNKPIPLLIKGLCTFLFVLY